MTSVVKRGLLFFVEDPGAANYILPVLKELSRRKLKFILLAASFAKNIFEQESVSYIEIRKTGQIECVLENVEPILIIAGTSENPDSLGLYLIDIAKARNIKSVVFVDSGANSDFRLRGKSNNPLNHRPDWLIVPDENTSRLFEGMGFEKGGIEVFRNPKLEEMELISGCLSLDEKKVLRKGILPEEAQEKLVIVFVSEISDGLNPKQFLKNVEYTLEGTKSNKRTEIVIEEFLRALSKLDESTREKIYLVLRKHPKETTDSLREYEANFSTFSQGGDGKELLLSSDMVVGMTSIMLEEACWLGIPTLSIIPRRKEALWLSEESRKKMCVVWDRTDVDTILTRMIFKALKKEMSNQRTSYIVKDLTKNRIIDYLLSKNSK